MRGGEGRGGEGCLSSSNYKECPHEAVIWCLSGLSAAWLALLPGMPVLPPHAPTGVLCVLACVRACVHVCVIVYMAVSPPIPLRPAACLPLLLLRLCPHGSVRHCQLRCQAVKGSRCRGTDVQRPPPPPLPIHSLSCSPPSFRPYLFVFVPSSSQCPTLVSPLSPTFIHVSSTAWLSGR